MVLALLDSRALETHIKTDGVMTAARLLLHNVCKEGYGSMIMHIDNIRTLEYYRRPKCARANS